MACGRRGWALALCLLACAGDAAREADRPFTLGVAQVESLEVQVWNGADASARVVARGQLPDPCTRIDRVQTRRLGNTFEVTLTTRREFGVTCAAMLVPFEREVFLPIDRFESGAYLVEVNGVSRDFHVVVHPDAGEPLQPAPIRSFE